MGKMAQKKYEVILFIILLSVLLNIYGCKDNSTQKKGTFPIDSYKDSVFIKIEGDLYNPKIIWENKKNYLQAYNRFIQHLSIKENRFVWDIQNGSQIKISDNIFTYIVEGWESQNKKLATGKYEIITVEDNLYYVAPLKDTSRIEQ